MSNSISNIPANGSNNFLSVINNESDGTPLILSDIASANFDGVVPTEIKTDVYSQNLQPGQYIEIDSEFYLVSKLEPVYTNDSDTNPASYKVWYVVDNTLLYKTINYNSLTFTDTTPLVIRREIWTEKVMGDYGWTITAEGNSIFSNVAVRGEINATSGTFSGYVTAGYMKIGTDVNSTNDGIYIDSNNYWYDGGLFSIGDGSSGVTWNGSLLDVTGEINATSGAIGGWTISSDQTGIYKTTGNSSTYVMPSSTGETYYPFQTLNNIQENGTVIGYPYTFLKIGAYYGETVAWDTGGASGDNVSTEVPHIELKTRYGSTGYAELGIDIYSAIPDVIDPSNAGLPGIVFGGPDGNVAGIISSTNGSILVSSAGSNAPHISLDQPLGRAILTGGTAVYMQNLSLNSYIDLTSNISMYRDDQGNTLDVRNDYASFTNDVMWLRTTRTSSTTYEYLVCYADYDGTPDRVAAIRGDGRFSTDLSAAAGYVGGGADYAEYFEWEDGNELNENRIGIVVVLNENGKIEPYDTLSDQNRVIGVVSSTPSFVGNGADLNWSNKYLKDEWGNFLEEEYSVISWEIENDKKKTSTVSYHLDRVPEDVTIPENAVTIEYEDDGITKLKRRVLNPEFDPNIEYISRENRKEWAVVGIVGVVRAKSNQFVKPGWFKIRDINSEIKELFIK